MDQLKWHHMDYILHRVCHSGKLVHGDNSPGWLIDNAVCYLDTTSPEVIRMMNLICFSLSLSLSLSPLSRSLSQSLALSHSLPRSLLSLPSRSGMTYGQCRWLSSRWYVIRMSNNINVRHSDMADKKSPMSEKLPTSPDKMSGECLGTKALFPITIYQFSVWIKRLKPRFNWWAKTGIVAIPARFNCVTCASDKYVYHTAPLKISFCITLIMRAWPGVCILTGTAIRMDNSCYTLLSDDSFATRIRPPGSHSKHPVSLFSLRNWIPFCVILPRSQGAPFGGQTRGNPESNTFE